MTPGYRKFFSMTLSGLACAAALSISLSTPVQAAFIKIPMAACSVGPSTPQSSLSFENGGVRNLSTTTSAALVCPVFTGDRGTRLDAEFILNGDQAVGTSTSCTITSWDQDGFFIASTSFTSLTSASGFQPILSIRSSSIAPFGYVYMNCSVPPRGFMRGLVFRD